MTDSIPTQLANAACAGTSFVPEKRGEQIQREYARAIQADYDALLKLADTDEKKSLLAELWENYRTAYRRRYCAYLVARSRCLSPMITGPAGFPTERNQKRFATANRRAEECDQFRAAALARIRKQLCPELRPIMAGDDDAIERIKEELSALEAKQDAMKRANVVIRKHKHEGREGMAAALIADGVSPTLAAELVTPDCFGDLGFASYRLRNNGAIIKRLKDRLARITADKAKPTTTVEGNGIRAEDDPPHNRIRLYFPDKPPAELRAKLKSTGYRWAPTIPCWQAYRNYRTLELARELTRGQQ